MKINAIYCLLSFVLFMLTSGVESKVLGQNTANVSIDFSQSDAGAKSMSGFLYGIEVDRPSESLIFPLKPKQWRFANYRSISNYSINPTLYNRIHRSGARFQLVLSDFWGYPGLNTNRPFPYQDYPQFENFVRQIARANNSPDIIWDIWNEPNEPNNPNIPYWRGTAQQLYETYRRAYRILRQELGPNIMIGGPSATFYDKPFITGLLNYCKANGCEVNFLTWHELNDNLITGVADRLLNARNSFLNNPEYASLKIKEIQINEIIGPLRQYNPGATLAYLHYLEKGRADGASKACWNDSNNLSNCFNGSLDGLITPNTSQTRAVWWAYKTYADGADSRVISTTTDPFVVALGSRQSDTNNKAQVLVSYFASLPSPPTPAPRNVALTLNNLNSLPFIGSSNQVRIKIVKIPNRGEQAVQNLELITENDYQISNNSVQLALNGMSPDEPYLITITSIVP